MYAFGNVHLSQVRSILFTFSVFCFLFITEIDSRFLQTANVGRSFPSFPSLYFKTRLRAFYILMQMKLVITKKGFSLNLVLKVMVFWNSEMASWNILQSFYLFIFMYWKKLSKWISFAPSAIVTSKSVCLLYIPPVVILVYFQKTKSLYLNLYVRCFFLYVIVFLFFSFFSCNLISR